MKLIIEKINLAKEAFSKKNYLTSVSFLDEAYQMWNQNIETISSSKHFREEALLLLEKIIALPELEITDYIINILAEEKAAIEDEWSIFMNSNSIIQFKELLYDLWTVIHYFDEYLGGMNHSQQPPITVGIESKGEYSFYENFYEDSPILLSEFQKVHYN